MITHLDIVFNGCTYQIPIETILYIESQSRKATIYTTKNVFFCYQKINEFEKLLQPAGFIRCHQSYLVASSKITSYTAKELYIGDTAIPISRTYQNTFKQIFSVSDKAEVINEAAITSEHDTHGLISCIKGEFIGFSIKIKPNQEIRVGRDYEQCDLIINLPLVSRFHCTITYVENECHYLITDHSKNGTFIQSDKRLINGEQYIVNPGTIICFGDKDTSYHLA